MLAGEPFEFLIVLTDMQEHEHLNRQALQAGKHVWSEKPIANSLSAGQELLQLARQRQVRLWGAPIPVQSPQFAFMAKALADGQLGRVAAAHADYGHEGPDWSSFFYEKGGGSMPDLAVYNMTTLTGLLGPAKHVAAMLSVVTPEREIAEKGRIKVEAEDNAMVLLDHGNGAISHIQSGFNYFNPHGHDGSKESRYTVSVVGSHGFLGLVGYDWAPLAVEFATKQRARAGATSDRCAGLCLAARRLACRRMPGDRPRIAGHTRTCLACAGDHHRRAQSQETGQRIALTSTFPWPVVKS